MYSWHFGILLLMCICFTNLKSFNIINLFIEMLHFTDLRQPSVLHHATLPVRDHDTCQGFYSNRKITLLKTQMCAGYKEGGKDSCQVIAPCFNLIKQILVFVTHPPYSPITFTGWFRRTTYLGRRRSTLCHWNCISGYWLRQTKTSRIIHQSQLLQKVDFGNHWQTHQKLVSSNVDHHHLRLKNRSSVVHY